MTSELLQQDISLWEIWIEYDHSNPGLFGMLYVLGEVPVEQKSVVPVLQKRTGYHSRGELMLQVPPSTTGRTRMKEVYYAEPIKDPGQYTSVGIYSGNELIARIEEIEVLV